MTIQTSRRGLALRPDAALLAAPVAALGTVAPPIATAAAHANGGSDGNVPVVISARAQSGGTLNLVRDTVKDCSGGPGAVAPRETLPPQACPTGRGRAHDAAKHRAPSRGQDAGKARSLTEGRSKP
ncbi:hypothetical protein TPA0598_19_00080 [Streptomyces lydicamycinicus]|uniref:Uncharacterized protein n=1 Tax=Streptomyces lydicamycinicus TaxID=1546107 RepID=A0A0P4RHZ6_9ACTN|nr:hypothetical protein TPA0598_19_00080 [Streptomyces lydicamycinicus]